MEAAPFRVDSIEIGERHRALSEDAVQRLAASIESMGLRTPITVRVVDDYVLPDGEVCDGVPVLVTGAHRLAAVKRLGWSHIDCIDADDDEITAEMWEISENLHRAELTTEQRHAQLRRYVELTEMRLAKPVHDGQVSTGGRGNKSVARIVAEETGVSINTVKRATGQIAKPAPEPKAPLPDYDVVTVQYNALIAAWNRAGVEARERFMAEIDAPVFDQTRAA